MPNLTRTQVQVLRKQLEAVLTANGVKGYDITLGNARYGDTEVTFKLVAKVSGAKSAGESLLATYAKIDGIDITKVSGRGEKLVEYHPRKRKYPYISQNQVTGARYKMSAEQAKLNFS